MRSKAMTRAPLAAVAALLAVTVVLPASHAAGDREELSRALHKAGGWTSYAFTAEEEPGPGSGGALEGRYQRGRPLACKADGIECFRRGDAVVYRQGGRWLRARTGTTSDPLRVLGALAKVRAARLPHEEVAELAKAVGAVRKEKDGERALYRAELSAAAARSLARPEHRGVARGGAARFWVGDDGRLVQYAVTIKVQGRLGGADVDGTVVKTVTLSGVGSTQVAVPEAARKALE
jgi:hypothetical protein